MKILVTGAGGFTGRHVVDLAQARGHDVVALQSDLRNVAELGREVAGHDFDTVLHLAGISFVGHVVASDFYDVNVIGTLNLLDALAARMIRPVRVVLAGSANVYGNARTSPLDETQAPAPVNHYAMSKLAMEYMARTRLDALPIVLARPFNYTGVGQDRSFLIPKLVAHFAGRQPVVELGNIDVEREFNDVRFVAEAYLRLLERGVPGEVYHICSGQPVSLRAVLDQLERITGHAIEVQVNPAFVRAHEVHRLCGNPDKLVRMAGAIKTPTLEQTLRWMLGAAYS